MLLWILGQVISDTRFAEALIGNKGQLAQALGSALALSTQGQALSVPTLSLREVANGRQILISVSEGEGDSCIDHSIIPALRQLCSLGIRTDALRPPTLTLDFTQHVHRYRQIANPKPLFSIHRVGRQAKGCGCTFTVPPNVGLLELLAFPPSQRIHRERGAIFANESPMLFATRDRAVALRIYEVAFHLIYKPRPIHTPARMTIKMPQPLHGPNDASPPPMAPGEVACMEQVMLLVFERIDSV